MYIRPSSAILNDNISLNVSNKICKRPFGIRNVTWQKNTDKSFRNSTFPSRPLRKSNYSAPYVQYDYLDTHNKSVRTIRRSDCDDVENSEKIPRAYATTSACYTHALRSSTSFRNLSQNLTDERNLSVHKSFEDLSSLLKVRNVVRMPQALPYGNGDGVSNVEQCKDATANLQPELQTDWLKIVENVIQDLKNAAAGRNVQTFTNSVTTRKTEATIPVVEETNWIDRVVTAHQTNLRSNQKRIMKDSLANNESEMDNTFENLLNAAGDEKSRDIKAQPNTSMSEYINRGPVNLTGTSKKQSSENKIAHGSVEEPKVELRMSSSQNESVVSINVDSLSRKDTDQLAADTKELSVVVQSNKNLNMKTEPTGMMASPTLQKSINAQRQTSNSTFKSMHISISEESVPVKQLEFAINGKPISTLKSILARSEKLDVVTSPDKIEIRVPFVKKNTKLPVDNSRATLKSTGVTKPVLNLQISANFDESRTDQQTFVSRKAEVKSDPIQKIPFSKTSGTIDNKNYKYPGSPMKTSTRDSTHEMSIPEEVTRTEPPRPSSTYGHQSSKLSTKKPYNTSESTSASTESQALKSYQSGMNISNKSQSSETRYTRKSYEQEDRVASNMVPWWSSDDSFNRLKKKTNFGRSEHLSADLKVESPKKRKRPASNLQMTQSQTPDASTKLESQTVKKLNSTVNRTTSITSKKAEGSGNKSKKDSQLEWLKLSNTSENEKGVNIKMKEKVDSDTIHVQDRGKNEAVSGAMTSGKNERVQRRVEEKSKSFPKDSSTIRVETVTSQNILKKKISVKPVEVGKIGKKAETIKRTGVHQKDSSREEKPCEDITISDAAIRNFMEAMKPIEKRSDGTLIDYGVKVASRRMSNSQNPRLTRTANQSQLDFDMKEVSSIIQRHAKKTADKQNIDENSTEKQKRQFSNVTVGKNKPKIQVLNNKPQTPKTTDIKHVLKNSLVKSATTTRSDNSWKKTRPNSTANVQEKISSTVSANSPSLQEKRKEAMKSVPEEKENSHANSNQQSQSTNVQQSSKATKSSVNTTKPTANSVTKDSSAMPISKEETVRTNVKESTTQDLKREGNSADVPLKEMTSKEDSTKLNNNTSVNDKTHFADGVSKQPTNVTNENKTTTGSGPLAGGISEESRKKIGQNLTNSKNPREDQQSPESVSAVNKNKESSDSSGSTKTPNVTTGPTGSKQSKSGSSETIKTSLKTRNQKLSRHYTKKDKPNSMNSLI